MINSLSDGELIEKYRANKDEGAVRVLLSRHYAFVVGRLKSYLSDEDAEDCAQKFWERFFRSTINSYKDDGRFENYLARSVTLSRFEHWRNTGKRERLIVPAGDLAAKVGHGMSNNESTEGEFPPGSISSTSAETELIARQLIDHLVNHLVPALPPEQRVIWLLRNEAEFYDPASPLSWETLAQLNGVTVDVAWAQFESARDKLIQNNHGPLQEIIGSEEFVIYIVWTHSQRPNRRETYKMEYFSKLFDLPLSTLKSRYRTAQKTLDCALDAYLSGEDDQ